MRQDSKTFSIEKSNPRIPSKNSSFSTGFVDWIPQSKKLGSEKLFFNSIRKPDFVSNRKPAFSIHFSDCIRISLKVATKYVFIFIFWSRCCFCCCCGGVLLLLPTTSVLKRRYYVFFFGGYSAAALHSSRGMWKKYDWFLLSV